MTHSEFIDKINSDFIGDKKALLITDWQSTVKSKHEYDPETYVFCEVITAIKNKRNVIRISAYGFKNEAIPTYINIDVLRVVFRSPSHPNIYNQETTFKTIFNGYMTNDGKNSEFSFQLLMGFLNSIEGFFR